MGRKKVLLGLSGKEEVTYYRQFVVEVPDDIDEREIEDLSPEDIGAALDNVDGPAWEEEDSDGIVPEAVFLEKEGAAEGDEPDLRFFRDQRGNLQVGE